MKAWLGTGKSKPRRLSLDLHYNQRTSIWSEIAARSHLVVAAVGTVALLGTAGTAIWMVLPSDGKNEIVAVAEAVPAKLAPVVQAEAEPKTEALQQAPEPAAAKQAAVTETKSADLAARGVAPIPVKIVKVAAKADVEPLDPTDPRWVEAAGKQAAEMAAAIEQDEQAAVKAKAAEVVTAFADEGGEGSDSSSTSGIPLAKMAVGPVVDDPDAAQKVALAGRPSSAVRAVTMRSKPSSRGGAIGTVPAKAAVQVVSCVKWCEIVYKGKRGFVYRSFLVNNGR